MASTEHITFPCLEVTQPIGKFYVGAIDSKDLVGIAYADIRRIEGRDVEKVLGIQRPLSAVRVEELRQFVQTIDASFPTSVILAVRPEHVKYDKKNNVMRIGRARNVGKIIDGQHRIAGLEKYEGPPFQVNVTVFVDMDLEDQALLFATINLKQTRVSKSLAYDLFEFASGRSPQKTCHNITKLLNTKGRSPFQGKIKILGVATGEPEETLTQAAFVDRLMPYISTNPMQDRDLLKRGKNLRRADEAEEKKRIFRNMFIDQKDAEIARVLWNFFTSVEKRWPQAWGFKKEGNILNRTTGFGALMRFLQVAYVNTTPPGGVAPISAFGKIFESIRLRETDFTARKYKPGSSGESELYQDFLEQSGLD